MDEANPAAKDIEHTIFHRSAWRDYYKAFLNHERDVAAVTAAADHGFEDFLREYRGAVESDNYDLVSIHKFAGITKARGWNNPYGWDSDSGITEPLTRTFRRAASFAFELKTFHHGLLNGKIEGTAYELALATYIHLALSNSRNPHPVYDAMLQSQAQVAEFGIGLRNSFELHIGKPMAPPDWDALMPPLSRLLSREGAVGRPAHFQKMAAYGLDTPLFDIRRDGENTYRVDWSVPDESKVAEHNCRYQIEDYISAIERKPVTGCPALFVPSAKRGGSFLGYVSGELLATVKEDFWPDAGKRHGCPYPHYKVA